MARKRKLNPGVGTLLGLAVLGVGGYVVYNEMKGKKTAGATAGGVKPVYAIGSDCMRITREAPTKEQEQKVLSMMIAAANSIGGHVRVDPNNADALELDFLDVLGPPPGEPANNIDFAQAWATAFFKKTVHPSCIKRMGISSSFGNDSNPFGADYSEFDGAWPGQTQQYLQELILVFSTFMQVFGPYETGMPGQTAMGSPSSVVLG